jgi:hypothetical protein
MAAMRMFGLLQDRAAMRQLDVARAAQGVKVAFLSGECGLFYIFWVGGEVRGEGC